MFLPSAPGPFGVLSIPLATLFLSFEAVALCVFYSRAVADFDRRAAVAP